MRKILLILVVLLAVFAVVVALQPAEFRLERSTTVSAPPAAVFAQVNDFHHWGAWSPWAKLDPNMQTEYSGPAEGPGAAYSWSGSGKVGQGKMTILESRPAEKVGIQLDFLKPMRATNRAEFEFRPEGAGTLVTWSMSGRKNFLSKAVCLFVSMDKLVGPDFEKGLASLKAVAESGAGKP